MVLALFLLIIIGTSWPLKFVTSVPLVLIINISYLCLLTKKKLKETICVNF